MNNKHFVFLDCGFWDNPGCSCCDDTYFESYRCINHELEDGWMGSISDIETAIALYITNSQYESHYFTSYEDELSWVKEILSAHGVTYEIEGEE